MPPALTTTVNQLSLKKIEKLVKKFTIESNGCWNWYKVTSNGYGVVSLNNKNRLAHRVIWELVGRELKEGLVINHLCENKKCVNPNHLEQVTTKLNIYYSNTPAKINSKKTHCKWGHEFNEKNTYVTPRNTRHCRICAVNNTMKWKRINRDTAVIRQATAEIRNLWK